MMSLLSKLNRVCWGPLKRALLQVAVTGAAFAVLLVMLALSGPGQADASSPRPLAHVAHHSRSDAQRRKPARGSRRKPGCAHATLCKHDGHSPVRHAHARHRSSEDEEEATAGEAAEEGQTLEGELTEEGSSEEEASGEAS